MTTFRHTGLFRSRVFGAILMLGIPAQPVYALLASCTVSTTNISFGVYDVFSPGNNDATGYINVSCSSLLSLLVSYNILLSAGGGSYAARLMSDGAGHSLGYNLYTAANRTIIWYDGTGGTGTVSDSYLLGVGTVNKEYSVYGRIPARQNVYAGNYSDNVTITINY